MYRGLIEVYAKKVCNKSFPKEVNGSIGRTTGLCLSVAADKEANLLYICIYIYIYICLSVFICIERCCLLSKKSTWGHGEVALLKLKQGFRV